MELPNGFAEKMMVSAIVYGTISLILGSMKKNGLEKTLEDLKSCLLVPLEDMPYSEEAYQALLNVIKSLKS